MVTGSAIFLIQYYCQCKQSVESDSVCKVTSVKVAIVYQCPFSSLMALGIKTVLQSAGARPDATVPPARRQRGKKSEGWMVAVL